MTDYSELVKALRGLANGIWKNCEYTWFGGEEKVFSDAAAAIENLQATIELMKPYMPDFFPDANKVTLPKMEVHG